MIRTIVNVVRAEGAASALRRARERVEEAVRMRGWLVPPEQAAIVNVAPGGIAARTGGVAIQLLARLRAERAFRKVALVETLPRSGVRAVHIDGTSNVSFSKILRLRESGIPVVISVHDFSLFCPRPHLLEQPMERFCDYSRDLERCERCLQQSWNLTKDDQAEHRELARELLQAATAVIFPSRFLFEKHRELFALPQLEGEVIEPGVPAHSVHVDGTRRGIAFAGSVNAHKGADLLPDVARMLDARGMSLHVFGGGDRDRLRALRALPNVVVHGYYRSGTLPSLLARHRIGLVLLPSIWPETYSLALSEAWLAGAAAAAFDLGAPAERIRRDGGGWLAPLEAGAAGLVAIAERWMSGDSVTVPRAIATPDDTARAHIELYRRLGLL